jgi:transmembrane sensor
MNPPITTPAMDEQASVWAARLEGSTLSAEERLALDAWLDADPAHRPLLSHYCQFSTDLELLLPLLSDTVAVRVPARRPRTRRPWKLLATLSLASATAIAAVVLWLGRPELQRESFATAPAQRQSLTLADGSLVELNAHTIVAINIDPAQRQVRLAGGEAFFSVKPDSSRPFVVETPAGSVRVTGTAFNVRIDPEQGTELIVAEGKVQVTPGPRRPSRPPQSLNLRAGEKLSVTPNELHREVLSASAIADATAWRQGQIVFDGVPLATAVDRFARYHNLVIIVAPTVADKRVGGRFSLDDPDGFLTALEPVLGVSQTRQPDGSILLTPREAE